MYCQAAKVQYLEVNGDIQSVGSVKLRYIPLDVDIDLETRYFDLYFSR